jgi:outer membrane protein
MNTISTARRLLMAAAGLAAIVAAQPAAAGGIQVKVLGTAVIPDGKLTAVELNGVGVPATTQTYASDNFVPTLAVEYFFTDNVSVETICCLTQHHVNGEGGLPNTNLVSGIKILPATVTAKYHFGGFGKIDPYIGVGPTYFIFIDEKPGATTVALGATRQKLNDKIGVAFQAGLDFPLNEKFSLSIDAKKYLLRTTARWWAGNTEVLRTRHQLDPWVISAGVGFRF